MAGYEGRLPSQADEDEQDYFSPTGAELLKQRIEAYWSERGYAVQVSLAPAGFTAPLRAARVDLRSDMVNGMPRRPKAS